MINEQNNMLSIFFNEYRNIKLHIEYSWINIYLAQIILNLILLFRMKLECVMISNNIYKIVTKILTLLQYLINVTELLLLSRKILKKRW